MRKEVYEKSTWRLLQEKLKYHARSSKAENLRDIFLFPIFPSILYLLHHLSCSFAVTSAPNTSVFQIFFPKTYSSGLTALFYREQVVKSCVFSTNLLARTSESSTVAVTYSPLGEEGWLSIQRRKVQRLDNGRWGTGERIESLSKRPLQSVSKLTT